MPTDPYTCVPQVEGDTRPQGDCVAGMVQVPPQIELVAKMPDPELMAMVMVLFFVARLGGPQLIAFLINKTVRIIQQL